MVAFTYPAPDRIKSKLLRLLTILPGTSGDLLDCLLTEYTADTEDDLYDALWYEALSYAWGEDTLHSNYQISLNGLTFAVTRNLEAALKALRKKHRNRVVWVDAICINQNDSDDKGRQVSAERRLLYGIHAAWLTDIRLVTWMSYTTKHVEFLYGWAPPPRIVVWQWSFAKIFIFVSIQKVDVHRTTS